MLKSACFKSLLDLIHEPSPQPFSLMMRRYGHLSNPGVGWGERDDDDATHEVAVRLKQAKVQLIPLPGQVVVS